MELRGKANEPRLTKSEDELNILAYQRYITLLLNRRDNEKVGCV